MHDTLLFLPNKTVIIIYRLLPLGETEGGGDYYRRSGQRVRSLTRRADKIVFTSQKIPFFFIFYFITFNNNCHRFFFFLVHRLAHTVFVGGTFFPTPFFPPYAKLVIFLHRVAVTSPLIYLAICLLSTCYLL